MSESYVIEPVGWVESPLNELDEAPRQGDEGGPDAWLVFRPEVADAVVGLRPGMQVIVVTWLDRANRDRLLVYPRGDRSRPQQGVFSTRAPHRPNPVGLHEVKILAVDGHRVHVAGLEALNGTPIVDLKPVLGPVVERDV